MNCTYCQDGPVSLKVNGEIIPADCPVCHRPAEQPAITHERIPTADELELRAYAQRVRKAAGLPTDPLIAAADDFQRAADELTAANAPVHVLADLVDEIAYLRSGDRAGLGSLEGAHERYAQTSRVSRRMTVTRWINRAELGQPSAAVQRALNAIGGV